MTAEKEGIKLKPAEQCHKTDEGHFGEIYKEIHQGQNGLVARKSEWNPQQWSGLQQDLMGRSSRDGHIDPGPYNKSFLEMDFGGKIYSLGQDTKTLTVDNKPVEKGSTQYKEAVAKMEKAAQSINFDSPYCAGQRPSLWEDLEQKKK